MELVTIYKGTKIIAIGPYHSKKRAPLSHSSSEHSQNLIKFKSGDADAVSYMASHLSQILEGSTLRTRGFYVATIPSSTQGRAHPGFMQLITSLAKNFSIQNPTSNILVRTESKTPAHMGGGRSKTELLATMGLSSGYARAIAGQPVLLLDDVTTTTNSLKAGIDLLLNAHANVVVAIALGRTQ